MTDTDKITTSRGERWWQVGMLWLVVGGPLAVVVASLVTAVVAYRGADPVLDEYLHAPSPRPSGPTDSQLPAMRARNLGATGR
jgi:hypothetical protein